MPKSKKIKVTGVVSFPRSAESMQVQIDLDPDNIQISAKPTVAEVTKAAWDAVQDRLAFKLEDGRGALRQVKANRKAAEKEPDTE